MAAVASWERVLPASLLPLQFAQQSLRSCQVIVENSSGRQQQVADQRIAHGVAYAGALFPAGDDVLRAQYRELLRYDGLIQLENVLKFLDAAFALEQHLEHRNADRVGQRTKEIRLEALQFASHFPSIHILRC